MHLPAVSREEMEHLAHKDHQVSTAHLVRTEMWAPLDPMDHQLVLASILSPLYNECSIFLTSKSKRSCRIHSDL